MSIGNPATTDTLFEAKRTGLARVLFATLHPRHARAASVNAEAVRLLFGSRRTDVSLGDVEAVNVRDGWLWSSVRVRHAAGNEYVSGLRRTDANAFADTLETATCDWWRRTFAPKQETLRSVHDRLTALADVLETTIRSAHDRLTASADALETARCGWWYRTLAPKQETLRSVHDQLTVLADALETTTRSADDRLTALADALETATCDWWRRTFAPQLETLRSVHDRLTALADPARYLTADAFRDLEAAAQTVAGGFAGRWPEALSDSPEIRMLRDILEFLEAPGDAKVKANEAYVVNELARSRELFDRIEARPLTEEQRRAVVVDERRNLVVAAAGSGKTSVIVAKTGWLIRKRVSEAVRTSAARLRAGRPKGDGRAVGYGRLGADDFAGDVTVRTFHGLGMAIIGEVEGKRPALAATVAENDRTLFDLLKGIVAELLADSELSDTLDRMVPGGVRAVPEPARVQKLGRVSRLHPQVRHPLVEGRNVVRSFEECEIANFLYLHGVAYAYEAPYEHDLATSGKAPVQARLPSSRARHLYRAFRDRCRGKHGAIRRSRSNIWQGHGVEARRSRRSMAPS